MSWFKPKQKKYIVLNPYERTLHKIRNVEYLVNNGNSWVKFDSKKEEEYSKWVPRLMKSSDFQECLFRELSEEEKALRKIKT